jgi:amidase
VKRREFVASVAGGLAALAAGPGPAFELDELTITQIGDGLKSGRWTSRRLLDLYAGRIQAIDRGGPKLGAIIEMNPEAEAIANDLDRERKQGHIRGPLHGIPILLKDNIGTADRMSTSAGSLALEGWRPPKDAFIAERLRAAGALILGKTNLSEWANFRSTHSVSGWSGRGKQTRNPYALNRNPSGSSSGSGAAVAANLCAAAIGTETDGSIVSPSQINGIVGIKPTIGLVSRSGIIPLSHSQDTAGPMARTVADAELLLAAIMGVDPEDSATVESRGKLRAAASSAVGRPGLRGVRLGVARKFFEKNAPLDRLLTHYVDLLKREGAEIIDPADLPNHGAWNDPEMHVLQYDFKADLNAYLTKLPPSMPARSLKDLIAFNQKNREREMPWFDQELFEQSEARGPLTDKKYLDARKDCLRVTRNEGIDAVMDKHKLDAIVTLTGGPAWLIDMVNGDSDSGSCSSPAAIAGYPHVTVPAGFYRGLPMSMSFFGRAWSDMDLISMARGFEAATKARRKPAFAATAEI